MPGGELRGMARSADSYASRPTNPSSIQPPDRPVRNPPRAITENPLFLLDLLNARVIYDCVPVKAKTDRYVVPGDTVSAL